MLMTEERLRAWLAGVVRNLARFTRRTEARRQRREQRAARPESVPSEVDTLERAASFQLVVEALMELPEPGPWIPIGCVRGGGFAVRGENLLRWSEEDPDRNRIEHVGPVDLINGATDGQGTSWVLATADGRLVLMDEEKVRKVARLHS